MKKNTNYFRKIGYVFTCLIASVSVVLFFLIPKARGVIKEIYLERNPSWNKGKRLYVSNHPSWLDQLFSITTLFHYWSLDYLPYVAVASDSIKRLPFLKFLDLFCFIVPIERTGNSSIAIRHIKRMQNILKDGYNVMIAGAPGRDFRAASEEIVFSPVKRKPLRKFTELSGLLAIQSGIETIPFCIDGTQKFYKEIVIDGRKEMRFSAYRFFILFWLLGRIKVGIIYGRPLVLEGKSRREATHIIQGEVLHLLDLFEG